MTFTQLEQIKLIIDILVPSGGQGDQGQDMNDVCY